MEPQSDDDVYYAKYLAFRCHHGFAHNASLGIFFNALHMGDCGIDVAVPSLRKSSVRHFADHGC